MLDVDMHIFRYPLHRAGHLGLCPIGGSTAPEATPPGISQPCLQYIRIRYWPTPFFLGLREAEKHHPYQNDMISGKTVAAIAYPAA